MLLAIDTCGSVGGVALGEVTGDGDPVSGHPGGQGDSRAWFRELIGKTFSELLLATTTQLLQEAGVGLKQLRGVVVVHGPGSFTGIRIGVSAAKGLAEGLGIPVIAVSRLELLARKLQGGNAMAVLDAGRGEFYAGFFRNGQPQGEALLTRDALLQSAAAVELPLIVCEPRVAEAFAELRLQTVAAPSAMEALRLGSERFRSGFFDDVSTLDANYLRRSETEMLARIAEHAALRRASSSPVMAK